MQAEGTYTLKDSYNEAAGKALYLDGSLLITLRLKEQTERHFLQAQKN